MARLNLLKLIIFCSVFLFFISSAFADDIGINLIEYHPDTYYTRLQISNNAGRDLNDLTIKIGDSFETKSEGILKSGAIYNAILGIPPGEHLVTVTTKEGVSSSKLVYFSLSKEDVQEEISRGLESDRKEQALNQLNEQKLIAENGYPEDRKTNIILIGIIIALVIGIIVIFWFIRGKKE